MKFIIVKLSLEFDKNKEVYAQKGNIYITYIVLLQYIHIYYIYIYREGAHYISELCST